MRAELKKVKAELRLEKEKNALSNSQGVVPKKSNLEFKPHAKNGWPLFGIAFCHSMVSSYAAHDILRYIKDFVPTMSEMRVPSREWLNKGKLMLHTLLKHQREEFISSATHLTILSDKTSWMRKSYFGVLAMNEKGEYLAMAITSPPDGTSITLKESLLDIFKLYPGMENKIVAFVGDSEAAQQSGTRQVIQSIGGDIQLINCQMHQCSNSETYCLDRLPKEPFKLRSFVDDFSEVFGPKQTDFAPNNVYGDMKIWCAIHGYRPFVLQGRRGSRFSWATRNMRFLIMNRQMILDFGSFATQCGRKHATNDKLKSVLGHIRNDWPFIYTYCGGLVCLWSYLVKHLFTEFAKPEKLGIIKSKLEQIRDVVRGSTEAENCLAELTNLHQQLFPHCEVSDETFAFSETYMKAITDGTIDGLDLNPHYAALLDFTRDCLQRIAVKLVRDFSITGNQNSEVITTANNQYCEGLFAVLKWQNVSLQTTTKDSRFTVSHIAKIV